MFILIVNVQIYDVQLYIYCIIRVYMNSVYAHAYNLNIRVYSVYTKHAYANIACCLYIVDLYKLRLIQRVDAHIYCIQCAHMRCI